MAERDRELAELAEVLREAARGEGSIAVVSAGIGCGRTELLDALRHVAAEAGFLVLRATGSWLERRTQGGVLGQLLRYTDAPAGLGGDLAHELTRVVGIGAAARGGAFEQWPPDPVTIAALHELSTEVVRISGRVPVLLCVDDIQFADSLSLHWILQLVRALRSSRIALVAAECTLSRSAHPHLHAELLRQPNYRRVVLDGLSPAAVADVLAERLGAQTALALAESCHRISGGNPLLLRALVEDQRRSGTPPGALPCEPVVAEAYADTVLSCLHRGRPPALRIAQALAVLDGTEADTGLLARLIEEEPATVDECRSALEAAGLIDGARLPHPVARSAVLRSLTAPARRELHLRAAELLHRDGANALRIAPHLLAAERGHPSWTASVLQEASERHLAADRPEDAHACLDVALAVSRDDGERVALRAQLAAIAWILDPSLGARHFGELTSALRGGRLPDRHALTLARHLLWHGRFEEAAEAVVHAGNPGRRPDSDPVIVTEARAFRRLLSATYQPVTAPAGIARAPSGGDARIQAAAALSDVLAHGPGAVGATDAEAALRAMRLGGNTHEWIVCAVTALLFAERLEAADSWCEHWLAEARSRRVPLWEAEFTSLLASIRLRQGDPGTARTLAEAALVQVPAEGWGVCLGGPLAVLVQAATETGDHEAAAEYLTVPVPDRMFSTRFGPEYLHARGRHHLETGRPHEALDDFAACAGLMRGWGCDQPALVPWRTESARAHLALADVATAQALAREQLALVGPGRTRTRGLTLRVLAVTGDSADRVALLTEAVGVLRAAGDPLQAAGALAELGRAHLREARPGRAREVFEMAAGLAGRCGAQPLATALAAELDALGPRGGRPTGGGLMDRVAALDLLSDAERRVAVLAVGGHTNKEISATLCVTVSTVEQHLTRIFRKLGVRARRDLPAEIALDPAETEPAGSGGDGAVRTLRC
ncbi:AAA family ATPase [Streptomyces sp. SID13666]|uniref:helix-turn-helix transcriptional regulator n=1 Tax=unclassified Streptomyces TaxID=2593676 RepID=UPI0013C0E8D6|nr:MULTISPECIES: LuxR family transcriptional regulator [unclassified Streptomyces]NEA55097.1 AAA family ATPase [Streptomyces sp. SID13666]NEA71104.1 AAA family ATPase [Streptomyces sp. SID13588]